MLKRKKGSAPACNAAKAPEAPKTALPNRKA